MRLIDADALKEQLRSTTAYLLINGKEQLYFNSEKETCAFLNVSRCSVASCYRRHVKCKGYTVKRIGRTSHLATKSRLHKIWSCMHERCEYTKHKHYKHYGGNGILVCDDWKCFEVFRNWAIANGYKDNLSIDRINNNEGYNPDNCRWVTAREQARNKKNNYLIYYNGQVKPLVEWAERFKINPTTLKYRVQAGWSIEKALLTPIRLRTKGYRKSKMDGDNNA